MAYTPSHAKIGIDEQSKTIPDTADPTAEAFKRAKQEADNYVTAQVATLNSGAVTVTAVLVYATHYSSVKNVRRIDPNSRTRATAFRKDDRVFNQRAT